MLGTILSTAFAKNALMEASTIKLLKNVMTSALPPTKFTPLTDVSAEMDSTEFMEFVEDALIEESIILSPSHVTVFLENNSLETNVCQFVQEMRPESLMELAIALLDTSECIVKLA